jgi:hypothetical protein
LVAVNEHEPTEHDERHMGGKPPTPGRASGRRHDVSPRALVLAWCLFLLMSWGLILQFDSPVPAVRWMVYACLVALMILWPVYRLSQDGGMDATGRPPLSPQRILLDWVCLALVLQTVLWPMHLTAEWTIEQTFWLDVAFCGWTAVTGLIVAIGCQSNSGGHRTAAVALCVLLLLGEPVLLAALNSGVFGGLSIHWTMRVSPLGAVSVMMTPMEYWQGGSYPVHAVSVAVAAAVGWVLFGLSSRPVAA